MIVSNLKLVVFSNPNREDLGKALRDWNLWGSFFFIVFLGRRLRFHGLPPSRRLRHPLDSALLLAFDLTQRTDSVSNKQHNVVLSYTFPKVIQHYLFVVAFALLAAGAVILTLNVSSPRRSICGHKKLAFSDTIL
ncbi:hypothetical protein DY000_02017328 [Brassica cretica]|uniref:Uncharacterized protein n=1 Tax=Brassica cretica TaxID=69181 RepID=A0ABQ7CT02_BRACR|nr:hypothetical protein DY000_02017328 [Brassica cretica]